MFLIVMRPRTLVALSLQIGKQSCRLESAQTLAANLQQMGGEKPGSLSLSPPRLAEPKCGRRDVQRWAARACNTPAHLKTKTQIDHWWKNGFNFLMISPSSSYAYNTHRATCFPKSYVAERQSLMVTAASLKNRPSLCEEGSAVGS